MKSIILRSLLITLIVAVVYGCGGGGSGSGEVLGESGEANAPAGYYEEIVPPGYEKISVEDAWSQIKAKDYLKTAKSASFQERESALKSIDGIIDATCDIQSCVFTLPSGEHYSYIYPLLDEDAVSSPSSKDEYPDGLGQSLLINNKLNSSGILSKKSTSGVICAANKKAIILEASIGTFFDEKGKEDKELNSKIKKGSEPNGTSLSASL